jgi:hypothetical protein
MTLADYNSAYQGYLGNYAQAAGQYGQAYSQYETGEQNALQTQQSNFGQAVTSQGLNFGEADTLSQQSTELDEFLASLGLSGASGTNAAGTSYANNATGLLTS